ncbi:hypothetical protein BZG36_01564 [Bifiguratus adelaidae]|uniref:protein-tyrosine-phosphatase n=1 Tax=Bifiguratus adelaidae TaxID=1938954 RepID=A0A261Y3Y0_9FUNG|nr:hypothetical protein BZG36_01564 [Bifiguratus adelaidae]
MGDGLQDPSLLEPPNRRKRNTKGLSLSLANAGTSEYGVSTPLADTEQTDVSVTRRETSQWGMSGRLRKKTSSHSLLNAEIDQTDVYTNGPVCILPHLFLGNERNAGNSRLLYNLNIEYILNVAKEVVTPMDGLGETHGTRHVQSSRIAHRHQRSRDRLLDVADAWATVAASPTFSVTSRTSSTHSCGSMSRSDDAIGSDTEFSPSTPAFEAFPSFYPINYRKFGWSHNQQNIIPDLIAQFAFIDEAISQKKSVLVHCQLGISRSASLVIAYVMRSKHMTLDEAFDYVKSKSPYIAPNMSLLYQLKDFETLLGIGGDKSTDRLGVGTRSDATRRWTAAILMKKTSIEDLSDREAAKQARCHSDHADLYGRDVGEWLESLAEHKAQVGRDSDVDWKRFETDVLKTNRQGRSATIGAPQKSSVPQASLALGIKLQQAMHSESALSPKTTAEYEPTPALRRNASQPILILPPSNTASYISHTAISTLLKRLARVQTSSLSDALKSLPVLDAAIKPMTPFTCMVGPAFTVVAEDDHLAVLYSVKQAQPGSVLVISTNGGKKAVTGELFASEARRRGLVGIVVDGYCRDLRNLQQIGLSVFARGAVPQSGSMSRVPIQTQVSVSCGGIEVQPGDIVVADEDGVLIAPVDQLTLAIDKAEVIEDKESQIVKAIAAAKAEHLAEEILTKKQLVVDLDRRRNSNREALAQLRKSQGKVKKMWFNLGDMFIKMPHAEVMDTLNKDQAHLDAEIAKTREKIKEDVRELEEVQNKDTRLVDSFGLSGVSANEMYTMGKRMGRHREEHVTDF